MNRPAADRPPTDMWSDTAPDALTGAVLAVEGIPDAAVLLNGPTGCKFFHGAVAEGQLPRESSYDPLRYIDEFYFGQPRVPSTYLDGDDYVFGASEKLRRILPVVAAKGHSLIAVVNTPGAALIGDDLERFVRAADLDVPCVAIESTGYSGTMEDGFQEAVIQTLGVLGERDDDRLRGRHKDDDDQGPRHEHDEHAQDRSVDGDVRPGVALLGISIFDRFWEGDVAELRRLLELCGVDVRAVVCAGSTVDELRRVGDAPLGVVVHEESADRLASWLEEHRGLRVLRPGDAPIGATADAAQGHSAPIGATADAAQGHAADDLADARDLQGAPIGFDATEQWLREVCAAVGVDSSPAVSAVDDARRRAAMHVKRFNSLTGLPKGATFTVQAPPSVAVPLRRWLHDYLGMVAVDGSADVVFGDGAEVARLHASGSASAGIEIALPSGGYVDVVPKCLLGPAGALYLLESTLNALNGVR